MPHIHELVDFTVGLFIVRNDKVLLVNHPRYQTWLCVGGHIEPAEDPIEASYREGKEEAGFEVTLFGFFSQQDHLEEPKTRSLITPWKMNSDEVVAGHRHVGLFYLASPTDMDAEPVLSKEHDEIRWFSQDELDGQELAGTWPWVKKYAAEAIRMSGEVEGERWAHWDHLRELGPASGTKHFAGDTPK